MKNIIKYFYKNTKIGYYLISLFIEIHMFYRHYILPDKTLLKRRFKEIFHREINLKNPETLNEKIVWLKLNDRTPLHTICADKYAVRTYIKEKIGEEYLVPLYYRTKKAENIIPENLPSPPFIIKTNHDSGGGVFVNDKKEINWEQLRNSLRKRLKQNYYPRSKEWQYKHIEPCIIVEQLLIDKNGKVPFDYKIHCFNGKVQMIQVDVDKFSDNPLRNYYNTKWEKFPFNWSHPSYNKKENITDHSKEDFKRPKTLDQMIFLSEILSSDFCYVRVDWYNFNGILYFGELTFHTDGGNRPIIPEKWDKILGDKLVLPIYR